jgi:serine protease inhibitor
MTVETKMPIAKASSCLKAMTLLSLLIACRGLQAQQPQEAQPAMFLHANDRFGANLLSLVHEEAPDRNIAIAPLPVSLAFAAMLEGSRNTNSGQEIVSTFHWERTFSLDIAARMLLARFGRPMPYPTRNSTLPQKGGDAAQGQSRPATPEEIWLSTAFLYRGKDSLSQDFMDRATYSFGIDFREVGEDTPQSTILSQNWDSSLPMPAIIGLNDFWITSFLHLRAFWAGNTFAFTKRDKHDFKVRSGSPVQADFLTSETKSYPYIYAKDFETIVLPCWEASLLLVLPEQDSDIAQLMASMAKNPDMVESLLKKQQGDVQLPLFHFSYESDFRESLEKMGLHHIFHDNGTLLAIAPRRSGGMLQGVAQISDIAIDEQGIRADAGTAMGGVFGGIEGIQSTPFHMILNRPFLFLIRDSVTNALLFSGVVMNPTSP